MKLLHPIKEGNNYLEEICPQENGVYLIYKVPKVARGMHGKNKGHVDEVLIVGMPWEKANKYLEKYGIVIVKEQTK